jgi:hypothetical protein
MFDSSVRFNIATILALIAVPWADIHFLLAVFRAHQWWDVIPLAGMLILTCALGWIIHKLWTLRDQLPAFRNALANIATVFQIAEGHPQGERFYQRITQSPEVFEREFRAAMNRGDQW